MHWSLELRSWDGSSPWGSHRLRRGLPLRRLAPQIQILPYWGRKAPGNISSLNKIKYTIFLHNTQNHCKLASILNFCMGTIWEVLAAH
jgi:hypothetical protein